ncbi:MAG: isochorismatase family protein [Armatimonadetes bacterium]|nr:isochorismatase family protein [Armatimonadota bacterium]
MPVISNGEEVIRQTLNLMRAAQVLELPVFVTEQYPKGLGATVAGVREVSNQLTSFEKTTFDGCIPEVQQALRSQGIRSLIVAGVETHVCVTQTVLSALRSDLNVHVINEATSSRTEANRQIGLQRMHDAGAVVGSVEMALFELLQESGTPAFKAILQIIK